MDDSTFDRLVAGFYRAATGETDWGVALDGVQQLFRARAAVLHTLDLDTGRLLSLHAGGPDLGEALLAYLRDYHLIDPRREHAKARGLDGLGTWVHCHEVFDEAFVAQDRFFQHYLPAYSMRYNSNVTVPIRDSVITGFILELPAERGALDADEREWARRLGLHMQEALRAHERVRRLAAQALAGHGLLRSFPYPMWLIDTDRYIHFSNEAAAREAESEARFVQRGAHLLLARQRADALLTERLHALRSAAHASTAVLDLRAGPSDPPIWLHLSLLIPGAVFGAFGERPMVLATLFDPNHVSTLDPFALAHLLKLTPTQARVAAQLAQGLTPEQIAVAHGTSISTVRTHIRELLVRLGAQRVADVVRMLRQGEALWAGADRGP